MDNHFFGCDVCQQVCPWNKKSRASFVYHQETNSYPLTLMDLIDLLSMEDGQLTSRFKGTAMARSKRQGLLRNACIVLGNSQSPDALQALNVFLQDETDDVLRKTAIWAITSLEKHLLII